MENVPNNSDDSQRLYRESLVKSINQHDETDGLVRCINCNEMICEMDLEDHTKYCEQSNEDYYDKLKTNQEITACKFCKELFDYNTINDHIKKCWKTCAFCGESFSVIDFEKHQNTCKIVDKVELKWKYFISPNDLAEVGNMDYQICSECYQLVEEKEFLKHPCILKKIEFTRSIHNEDLINEMQKTAVIYVQERALESSQEKYNNLLIKFKKLDFNEFILDKTLKYISLSAPIIIHFNPVKTMKLFENDTHYRNLFETSTSGGTTNKSARRNKENDLFNKIYNYSSDFDRPKYGVLNIVNDRLGVQSCARYGDSYFILNNDTVRLRCTFASGNTFEHKELATLENYCHILNTYSDEEIIDVVRVAMGECTYVSSVNIKKYKEIQIHGPLKFDRDFSKIVLNKEHLNNIELIASAISFSEKNKIMLEFTE